MTSRLVGKPRGRCGNSERGLVVVGTDALLRRSEEDSLVGSHAGRVPDSLGDGFLASRRAGCPGGCALMPRHEGPGQGRAGSCP